MQFRGATRAAAFVQICRRGLAECSSIGCAEDVSIRDAYGDASADLLRELAGTKSKAATDGCAAPSVVPERLQLDEGNVAKVTRNGITHIEFIPSASTSGPICLAAVDKSGHVRGLHFALRSAPARPDEPAVIGCLPCCPCSMAGGLDIRAAAESLMSPRSRMNHPPSGCGMLRGVAQAS